jgi:hypothetical protein
MGFARKKSPIAQYEQNDEWQPQHRYMQVEVMAELATAGAPDPRQIS